MIPYPVISELFKAGGIFPRSTVFFIVTSDFFVKLDLCIPVWEVLSSHLCGRVVSRLLVLFFLGTELFIGRRYKRCYTRTTG